MKRGQKKVRCHNRQIHKTKIDKGGVCKREQTPYLVKGFRLFDKVGYEGQGCFIFGRRSSGSEMEVYYDPDDPGKSYVNAPVDNAVLGHVFLITGAGIAVLGILLYFLYV